MWTLYTSLSHLMSPLSLFLSQRNNTKILVVSCTLHTLSYLGTCAHLSSSNGIHSFNTLFLLILYGFHSDINSRKPFLTLSLPWPVSDTPLECCGSRPLPHIFYNLLFCVSHTWVWALWEEPSLISCCKPSTAQYPAHNRCLTNAYWLILIVCEELSIAS